MAPSGARFVSSGLTGPHPLPAPAIWGRSVRGRYGAGEIHMSEPNGAPSRKERRAIVEFFGGAFARAVFAI